MWAVWVSQGRVVDFGGSHKRVYIFVLVDNRNFVLPCAVSKTLQVFSSRSHLTHIRPKVKDVPIELDRRCMGSEERRPQEADYSCDYIHSSPTYMATTIHQRFRETNIIGDGGNTAHCTIQADCLSPTGGYHYTQYARTVSANSCKSLFIANIMKLKYDKLCADASVEYSYEASDFETF